MKQWTFKNFSRILLKNGYSLDRVNGSHYIFVKDGNHISVPSRKLECVIARRLIKENQLDINL